MSTVYLERMFRPRSVAVVGASNRPHSVGNVIMRNLLAGGFDGPIMPVNPRSDAVAGVLTWPDVASLPRTPDLAVLCTPPRTVPDLLDELGARGTRAALVVAHGLDAADGAGRSLRERALAAARAHRMRFLGGSTLGVVVPRIGLDASFSRVKALPGEIGFVSQSDALGAMVLDWAYPRRVGFSSFISLGEGADIGFGEALDYLGSDPDTRAILLYVESLRDRRTFMAAARGAARNKPVVAIKAGRPPPGRRRGAPISGDTLSLVDPDEVWDAALRRAGVVRVQDLAELFQAVETLARARPPRGDRLAVVSNGGGAGGIAVDALHAGGLALAQLSDATVARLRAVLPHGRLDGRSPIDLHPDAGGPRHAEVLKVLAESKDVDAVLAIHTPSALASSTETARAVIDAVRSHRLDVLACWLGEDTLAAARRALVEAGVPSFDTPGDAARAFLFQVSYRRSREALIQTPPSVPAEFQPDVEAARAVVRGALADGRDWLRANETMQVLGAYGVPVADVRIADTPEEAARVAREIGFPVELTIRSPDVRRKGEVGGVAASLDGPEAVEAAARRMAAHLSRWRPDARLTGFTIQRMLARGHARELFVGAALDPLFGPIILFGEGRASELFRDFSVGLPPLNLTLARNLVARTRVAALLEASPSRPAADVDAVVLGLMKVSQLVADLPEVVEIDVNPLLADEDGIVALRAFMRIAPATAADADRLAIRPYPKWLEETFRLRDGREVLLRPIRPEDEPAHRDLLASLSPEDSRFRFFHYVRSLPQSEMARLTQIDYDREMAFIATLPGPSGAPRTLAAIRAVASPDGDVAEFSLVVRQEAKRQGLGTRMLAKMVDWCRSRGVARVEGDVLGENEPMLELVRRFEGFRMSDPDRDGTVRISYPLTPETK